MSVELGATLRDAREARQLAFEEVAAATRIHPRYLAALEAERFDTLPGRAYARSFLHEYAAYLGLDPAPLVAEYDGRFCETRIEPAPLMRVHRSQRSHRVLVSSLVLVVVIGGGLAWKLGSGSHSARIVTPRTPAVEGAVAKPVRSVTPAKRATVHSLLISASNGPCWLLVRADTRRVYERTLQPGQSVRFTGRTLWVRFGAPWNVDVRVDGKARALPGGTQPINVTFSPLT